MDTIVFLGVAAGPFLGIAVVLLLIDFLLLFRTRPSDEKTYALTFISSLAACIFVIASYLILTAAFLANSFSFREVYTYSSSGLSVLYKLGGPWIGSSGSLLFIAALLALGYAIYRVRSFEKEGEVRIVACQVLDLFLAFFILVTLLQNPFRQLSLIPPEGMGLNPLLQTPWVLIHPPIIFLGYVAVFFAFILFLAWHITNKRENREKRPALHIPLCAAWLLLTIGIALGGLWSYRVLGWGGYWAWDPVETASLLPWLALTAYFHWSFPGREDIKDLLLTTTFFMVIFATALTRGGFSESVHAFGESPVAYLLLGFGVAVLLVFIRVWRREGKTAIPPGDSASRVFRYGAAGSLVALLLVCFIGSAAPIAGSLLAGRAFTVEPAFFTLVTLPFTLVLVACLIGCHTTLSLKHSLVIIGALMGAGIVLAATGVPTPYALANLGLPVLITAGGVVGYRWVRDMVTGKSPRVWGRTLIHLAIVITLIGVFVSSAAQSESDPVLVSRNSGVNVLGSTITLENFTVFTGTGGVYYPQQSVVAPEYSGLKADVTILNDGTVYRGSLWMYEYLNYGVVSEPLIIPAPAQDLYISMHQTNSSYTSLVQALKGETVAPKDVTVVMKYVPLIWLVWLGIVLMSVGMGVVGLDALYRMRIPV